MPNLLQHRFARLLTQLRGGFAPPAAKPSLPSGSWVLGTHRESDGLLALAPLLAPHRAYRLYLPAGYDPAAPMPLVVMVHGCKQDGETFAAGTRMNALADRERFMVLYPEQRTIANPDRCWNWFDVSSHRGGGEAAIIAGMVRALRASYRIDASRVYIAGLSSGAAMASILASCHAELFAACAIHSGVMFQAAHSVGTAREAIQAGSKHDPAKAGAEAFKLSGHKVDAMPAIVIHGTSDARVNPVNAEQVVAQFAHMNRLAQPSTVVQTAVKNRRAPHGAGRAYEMRDHLFDGRVLLRHIVVDGLEHAWSGGDASVPFNDPLGPDASELIWDFFQEHRRHARPMSDRRAARGLAAV
jgi:poly(hydroxyalkanoate) depolymerase family esterase